MEAGLLSDQTKSPRPVHTHAVLSVRVSTVRDLVFFSSHLGGREQVDNRYVLKKLKALLLAVLKKDWYRLPSEDEVKDDVSAIKVCDTYLTRFFFRREYTGVGRLEAPTLCVRRRHREGKQLGDERRRRVLIGRTFGAPQGACSMHHAEVVFLRCFFFFFFLRSTPVLSRKPMSAS